ncbi:MAG: helix-turn-helix domain-containing protein [Chloroflexi bacterium]|nr:helix-turn-helix domain-containing protein [Chloroflexota bacterium]
MAEDLVSPTEAAEIAGCHHDTIRRAIQVGSLKAKKIGNVWIIKTADLQEWIQAGMPNRRRKSVTRKKDDQLQPDEAGQSHES